MNRSPITIMLVLTCTAWVSAAELRGRIEDAESGAVLPARLYIESADGVWHFARSAAAGGSAFEYRKQYAGQDGRPDSVEMHTTLSAHPFTADLAPGRYTLTAERGKEYLPASAQVTVGNGPAEVTLKLSRWVHMAGRGWYSGDTHNHIALTEMPNRMLAEDLNVALPITYWVTDTLHTPLSDNKVPGPPPESPRLIEVAPGHVIWPVNTEYEYFTVAGKRHTLGAILIAGHTQPFTLSGPPIAPIAELAHRQGGLIDLDKHNWPWSMMLVPIAKVDLFELSNNHVWRTNFFFRQWESQYVADWMNVERDEHGKLTESGWLEFGFRNYYALLNCGFRLRPTAGTAAGVHPVPLGFGRVYVRLAGGFDYAKWMEGLNAGRSFVTTGPMLPVTFSGQDPGHTFRGESSLRIAGEALSAGKLDAIEIIVNGEVARTIRPENRAAAKGGYVSDIAADVPVDGSSWVAVRCFEPQPDGRRRFAHTAPVHVDVPGRPLRPRGIEVEYLVSRITDELARNRDTLPAAALAEYEQALEIYKRLMEGAR